MRIAIAVKGGSGSMFGGSNSSTEVTFDAIADYELGAATVSVLNVLAAHGIGSVSDSDDESVGTTAESEKGEPEDAESESKPGASVRLTFDDGTSRLFIDTGEDFQAPHVRDRFDDPMVVAYDDPSVERVDVVFYESER